MQRVQYINDGGFQGQPNFFQGSNQGYQPNNYRDNIAQKIYQQQSQQKWQDQGMTRNMIAQGEIDISKEEIQNIKQILEQEGINDDKFPNKLEKLSKILQSKQMKFTDPYFKPCQLIAVGLANPEKQAEGLYNEHAPGMVEKIQKNLVWLRPEQMWGQGQFQVFAQKIEPNDIVQSELGNCFFLASLSSLAENPERIKRLFSSAQVSNCGAYSAYIYVVGTKKEIIIDDYFPCDKTTNGPIFNKSNGNELWVLILEKIWVKIHGSYERIIGGLPRDVMRDLTGAPTRWMHNQTTPDLWETILEGENKNWAMCCSSEDNLAESSGLAINHAYSLLAGYNMKTNQGVARVVKLRNPWGNFEWTGDWSDKSPLWTPELRQRYGFENRDDGIFFMSFEDYKLKYYDTQICMIDEKALYSSIDAKQQNYRLGAYIKMTVDRSSVYFITISQPHTNTIPQHENYQYGMSILYIGKQTADGYKYIDSNFGSKKTIWCKTQLEVGDYIVYAKPHRKDKSYLFNVSAYGQGNVTFQQIDKQQVPKFKESVIFDMVYQQLSTGKIEQKTIQTYDAFRQPKCKKVVNSGAQTTAGTPVVYGYIFYQNFSDQKLNEDIDFSVSGNNIKLLGKHKGQRNVSIQVYPQEQKLIFWKKYNFQQSTGFSTRTQFRPLTQEEIQEASNRKQKQLLEQQQKMQEQLRQQKLMLEQQKQLQEQKKQQELENQKKLQQQQEQKQQQQQQQNNNSSQSTSESSTENPNSPRTIAKRFPYGKQSQILVKHDEKMEILAREKGKCTRKLFQGEQTDILVYEFIHQGGAMLVYINYTEDKVLKETIRFAVEGYELQIKPPKDVVEISLEPGKKITLSLKKTKRNSYLTYTSKYKILEI